MPSKCWLHSSNFNLENGPCFAASMRGSLRFLDACADCWLDVGLACLCCLAMASRTDMAAAAPKLAFAGAVGLRLITPHWWDKVVSASADMVQGDKWGNFAQASADVWLKATAGNFAPS